MGSPLVALALMASSAWAQDARAPPPPPPAPAVGVTVDCTAEDPVGASLCLALKTLVLTTPGVAPGTDVVVKMITSDQDKNGLSTVAAVACLDRAGRLLTLFVITAGADMVALMADSLLSKALLAGRGVW